MSGIFGGLANAVGGAQAIGAEEQRRRAAEERQAKLDAQAEADRQITRAATLASLSNAGIVTKDQMAPKMVESTLPGLSRTPNLVQPGADTSRYNQLGDSGFYQDKSKTSDALQSRALARREKDVGQRMAILPRLHPELANADKDMLRSIAEDDKAWESYSKPVGPEQFRPVPEGTTNLYGERSGTLRPTGEKPKARPPVMGTPEYNAAEEAAAAARARGRNTGGGSGSGNAPLTEDDRARVALNQRIGNLQHQITASQKDAELAEVDGDTTRSRLIRGRIDSLRGQSDTANMDLAATVRRRSAGRTASPAAATSRAGITEGPAVTKALDPNKDEIVMETYRRIKAGQASLKDAVDGGMSQARVDALKRLLAGGKG